MPSLEKECPGCGTIVHVRKLRCPCGHVFHRLKNTLTVRKQALETTKVANASSQTRKRALESNTESEQRKKTNAVSLAHRRALETEQESEQRRKTNAASLAHKRALETEQESEQRKIINAASLAHKIALETEQESEHRRKNNAASLAHRRALETEQESEQRRKNNAASLAHKRALETEDETRELRIADRTRAAKRRALESEKQSEERRLQSKRIMASKRHPSSPLQCVIDSFVAKTKQGPDYVCTSCHRLMYRQSVSPLNVHKYAKASPVILADVFSDLYTSFDGNQWICATCNAALTRGNMPTQAVANGLRLSPIPPELSCLNALEIRLLSLRVPFMKMVALPSGKQRCIHGPAVNVPSKLDSVCTVLPRLPSQSELIPLKLKRKLAYKGHYLYDYITPDKILTALRWLKTHNPLYADIEIDEEWVHNAESNDLELYTHLVNSSDIELANEPDNSSEPANPSSSSNPSSDGESSEPANPSSSSNPSSSEPANPSSSSNPSSDGDSSEPINNEHSDLVLSSNNLEKYAQDNNLTIHNVAGDGNCLYNAALYQLNSNGVTISTVQTLRHMVATYLNKHADTYMPFVVTPVASDSPYNHDTAVPDAIDAYISSIPDPNTSSLLAWERYLERVTSGSWGDHVVIAALANMFNATINVVHARPQACSVATTSPTGSQATFEINLGLLMQYHFVGLDNPQVTSNINQQTHVNDVPNQQTHANDFQSALNEATIEEGDEHTRQITGSPLASMMTIENPEAHAEVVCVAPAEGQRPLSIMTDSNFEAMSNPDKFPIGGGCFGIDRPRKLTYRKYFNQRLLDVDGRFAKDIDYLFVGQYIVEAKQILDDATNFIWRQKPGRDFTAQQAKNRSIVSQCLRNDKAYRFMKNVRGSPPYYQRTFYELLAMVRQLGTPTWFFTLSAADMKWPDIIQTIGRQYGVIFTDEQVAALSYEDKSNWIKRNPVTAARHYQYRLNTFFQDFLKSPTNPLGELVDYVIRIEFQARGSPHAHCVLWVKDAPKYGVDDNANVCQFIDKYITCSIPADEGKLKDLVLLVQQHRHSSYCKRIKGCRFNFPHPPSSKTLIAEPGDHSTDSVQVLTKVRKVLADNSNDLSLDELLTTANLSLEQYVSALEVSTKGSVIILKRKPIECNINNYNAPVMLAWQANMDIQYVLNAYACVMYVASYMMKTEKAMGELLKRVAAEARTEELKMQMRKVGSAFLTHREVSAQEAVYRILSLPMKQFSRSVVFVDTNPKHERIAVLKDSNALKDLDDADTDVFQKSLIDRYEHRPLELQSMCLAEFAATFVTKYKPKDGDTNTANDVLPPTDTDSKPSQITLTAGFGQMNKRRKQAVIRFRSFNKDNDSCNWFRAKLMLYLPWYSESPGLLGGYSTYEEHYNHVKRIIIANEAKYNLADVDSVEIDENSPPEHAWNEIAPNTEACRAQSLAEGAEPLTQVSQEDLDHNASLLTSSCTTRTSLHVRFEAAANKQEIPPVEYRALLRALNTKQRQIVMFHRHWCKKAVLALKQGKPIEPYHVFMSGPGGVGKSHVIRLIHSDTLKLLRLSGAIEPDDVIVLLTAPTGVAAFLINGMTLHSALLLGRGKYGGFQPLSHDRLNSLRSKLSNLVLLIIDEVSMVGSNMLLEIHKRLQQLKAALPDVAFGGVSILAVGDLYQLPPVGQAPIFSTVSDSYANLYCSGSLWVDEFKMIELDEIMRQRGDSAFCGLLCRVRTAECTNDDLSILKSREIVSSASDYPNHVLHVYRLNVDVDARNSFMLNALAPETEQYSIQASDAIAGQTQHIGLSTLSDKRADTGGLHNVLKLAIGARVMLTTNVDVSDGLVNGARGEVVHIATNHPSSVTHVLVKFDNLQVGTKAKQSSPFQGTIPDAVPLVKHETVFLARGKRGSEVTRLQFPLTLAWATTIHKVQGLTLDDIVVDMKGGRFSPGQAYVAFSRVKSLQGLHILNFNPKAIKASDDVKVEMQRLNENLLSPIPVFACPDNHITIALLNVRSIIPKVPDIHHDDSLQSAAIICFTETWLTHRQASPTLADTHTVLRCDRMSDDNKGGVMISLHQSIQPAHVTTFSPSGIPFEAITATFLFPNHRHLQVIVVYRSPSVCINTLMNQMSTIMRQVRSCTIPCIVLGDFNEDLLTKPDSQLMNFMSHHGFSQLVQSPTTDNGTLIDHVYYNRPSLHLKVQISDTYYSDHDTVFCTLPDH